MSDSKHTRRLVMIAVIAAISGCGGEPATPQSIKAARALWDKERIRNYDFEWECSGLSRSHYFVAVRDGQVRSVEVIAPDGKRYPAKPADTTLYSVNGLFTTVDEELAQPRNRHPLRSAQGNRSRPPFHDRSKVWLLENLPTRRNGLPPGAENRRRSLHARRTGG